MKILVCVKVVPDYEELLPQDWQLWSTDDLNLNYVKKIYNCFDEAALETALRVREEIEKLGESVRLCAVSVAADDSLLEHLYAVGFDQVDLIVRQQERKAVNANDVSLLLPYIEQAGPFDLILCGDRSDPGNYGHTGIHIASHLKCPCLTGVSELHYDGEWNITRQLDHLVHQVKLSVPAVLTIGNAQYSYLQLPTLKQKISAKKKQIGQIEGQDHLPDKSSFRIRKLIPKSTGEPCEMIEGASIRDKAEQVYKLLLEQGMKV